MATTATPLQKELIAESYQDVRDLILWTVHKFRRRHGGDFEQLFSSACYHFMRAYHRWDVQRGSFTNWVAHEVYTELLEDQRNAARRHRLAKIEGTETSPLEKAADDYRTFSIMEFLDELGDDAQIVAKLVLDTPSDLMTLMMSLGGKPMNRRRALREYLRELGWTAVRISETFSEIADVLTQY